MIHPLPSGTRDVLPDEMRERRAVTDALRRCFLTHGYGEVETPAIEYDEVVRRGGGGVPSGYRVFDDHGAVLTLRTDMTVPIARLVATRYPAAEPPLRFCYLAHAYRTVRPHRGHMREFLQAGVELVGSPAPDGTAEAITVLCSALDAIGLRSYRIGLGDASLYPSLLDGLGVPEGARARLLSELGERDLVGLEREVRALGLAAGDAELLLQVAQRRGGRDLLGEGDGLVGDAVAGLRAVMDRLESTVADRIVVDLGLTRDVGYYTGPVFEVYDPELGAPLGGGGHYDDLLARFGRDLPAVGFALVVDRLLEALAGEERASR